MPTYLPHLAWMCRHAPPMSPQELCGFDPPAAPAAAPKAGASDGEGSQKYGDKGAKLPAKTADAKARAIAEAKARFLARRKSR